MLHSSAFFSNSPLRLHYKAREFENGDQQESIIGVFYVTIRAR